MKRNTLLALGCAALAIAGCAAQAQDGAAPATGGSRTTTTPEGALMQIDDDLPYKPGTLTPEQLSSPTRSLFVLNGMNVFRRFPRENTEAIVKFYTEALKLRSLNPIQLTSSQQMLLTGVGSAQIKLAAGQQGNRKYNMSGGYRAGTGIRFLTLTYPNEADVVASFTAAGFPAPSFGDRGDGTRAAMVDDPSGFPLELVIRAGAKPGSNDGVGVNINTSDLERSRAFYREFVGLDELPPVEDKLLGITRYPFRHGETTISLYHTGTNEPADNGSAGIQYVVSDTPMVDAKAKTRNITVETPLNKLRGFELITVWLNDPDGVTNYFAQVNGSAQPASNGGTGRR